jgi:hypothetical protein
LPEKGQQGLLKRSFKQAKLTYLLPPLPELANHPLSVISLPTRYNKKEGVSITFETPSFLLSISFNTWLNIG